MPRENSLDRKQDVQGKTILVVAAHPDDPEFGCGGTMAAWVGKGAQVYYVICTTGQRGGSDSALTPDQLASVRRQEQQQAAKFLGVREVFFLGHEDGNLIADISLKEEIVKLIRQLKPDIVFTHDPSWIYVKRPDFSFINHHDHRQTGIATLDAIYPLARDALSFPKHVHEGFSPHTVREVYLFNFDRPDTYIDVTETFDVKLQAIKKHRSQVKDPKQLEKWLKERLGKLGKQSSKGYQYAEGFNHLVLR